MKGLRVFESDNGQKIHVINGVVVRHVHRPEVVGYNNHEGKRWKDLNLEGFREVIDPEDLEIEEGFIKNYIYYKQIFEGE